MVDKVSLTMDLVRSELKRAAARVTVTLACQSPQATQQQQTPQQTPPQDDIDSVGSPSLAEHQIKHSSRGERRVRQARSSRCTSSFWSSWCLTTTRMS